MENDVLDSLNDIGYKGPICDKNFLTDAVKDGPKNLEYTKLVNFLTNELRILCNIDECVNVIAGPEDSISFLMELSSFLKELGCPFAKLTQGHITDRLATAEDNLLLLDYLTSELMAAQMVTANKPDQKIELKLQESPMANDLKSILVALKFNKPPPNITPELLFKNLMPKLQETVKKAGSKLCGNPIFDVTLTDEQWKRLSAEQDALHADYTIRREMLLKRLDCTIQSFQWSDKIKGKEDEIVKIYYNKRKLLKVNPDIDISDLLAARDDLAIIEKTSNASVRKNTRSSLNKLIIGKVPDRGGRPSEQKPPPPEMPAMRQRTDDKDGRWRGGNQKLPGYTHSNINKQNQGNNQQGGNFVQGASNYQRGRGNYHQRGGNYQGGGNYYQGNDFQAGYQQPDYAQSNYGFNQGGSLNAMPGNSGRSYESFQHNRKTYSDQYVQDTQHNQQYSRGSYNPRGQHRGRSNYNRGNYH